MIYLFLADGFEDIEVLAPLDMLRRAGLSVKTVGVTGKSVVSSHSVKMEADILPPDAYDDAEMIILPGGKLGTENLGKAQCVRDAIEYCMKNGVRMAAICAAPSVLGRYGALDGRKAVCFPGFEDKLSGAKVQSCAVVTDGLVTTAKSAGHSVAFGLELVRLLAGDETAEKIRFSIMQE